jgi:hypothetical protein
MLSLEYRQMFRTNGLIDDFVLHGKAVDYVVFAEKVAAAIGSGKAETLRTASTITIEISCDGDEGRELFTAFQNSEHFYRSIDDWNQRDILRLSGSAAVLESLRLFLLDLSTRDEGYSYLAEYSDSHTYCTDSPEWRLHLEPGEPTCNVIGING